MIVGAWPCACPPALIAAAVTGRVDVERGADIATLEEETKMARDELLTGGIQ